MVKKLPAEFCSRIEQTHADAPQFLDAISSAPCYSVRLNPHKVVPLPLSLDDPVPWCDDAFYLAERPNYTMMPEFHAGAIYPQEASSMFLHTILKTIEPQLPAHPIVLDLCAAPGGKSTLAARFLDGRGVLVANEYLRQRAWILAENIAKQGYANTLVINREAQQIGQSGALFDVVLIDAPCSGEGMFRKDDTAISEWTPANAEMCARRQREIIAAIADSVVEGGYLIYSTCTFNPAENEDNMKWLVEEYDFENVSIPIPDDSGIMRLPFAGGEGYAFYPHKVRGEGFFICAMRKVSGRVRRSLRAPKVAKAQPSDFIINKDNYLFYNIDNKIVALPSANATTMLSLTELLRPLRVGVEVGEEGFAPSPSLPLSLAFNAKSLPICNVEKEAALKFLHGDAPTFADAQNGWFTVQYYDLPLGLCKQIGARANNYYPKEWRIRAMV